MTTIGIEIKPRIEEYKLCFVKLPWVYFTTQELSKQWGDDWNDSPYECNAGTPYPPNRDRGESWEILKLAISTHLVEPKEPGLLWRQKIYSVEDINNHAIAWLRTWENDALIDDERFNIMAGTTLKDFVDIIERSQGEIYLPKDFEYYQPKRSEIRTV